MKFKLKTWAEIEAWHSWFAWYPIQIKGKLVWLEWVERRTPYLKNAGVSLNGPLPTEYRQ
jgi:hypothetical protein